MNIAELKEKSQGDLAKELESLTQQHFKLKMQHGSGQLNSTHQLRQVRRDIARVLTVISDNKAKQEAQA